MTRPAERLLSALRAAWLGLRKGVLERLLGEERLARWLEGLRFYELKSRLVRYALPLPDGGSLVLRPMDRRVVDEVLGGCYAEAELREGAQVLDVGANIGAFSVLAARRIGPRGRLLAVEPDPENFRLLRLNLERNALAWAAPLESALDRAPGRLRLYRSGDPAMHTLSPRYARHVEVAVDTLDRAAQAHGLDAPDLVKVDVEGAELGVLAGGGRTLARTRQLILETHPPDREAVKREILRLGFVLRSEREDEGGITLYAVRPG